LQQWYDELEDMRDVLLGHEPSPVDRGILTLMEVADAYYGRAREIEQMILRAEADGQVTKGSRTYRFRTGELRAFIEMCAHAAELGSRRLTAAKLEYEMRHSI
jgi:hypothetical protein